MKIELPDIGTNNWPADCKVVARDVVYKLRNEISGRLHNEILKRLLERECPSRKDRLTLSVNDMINRLDND